MDTVIRVGLVADPGKYISGMSQAGSATDKFGQTLQAAVRVGVAAGNAFDAAANKIASAGKRMMVGGAAVGASLLVATKSAAQFQTNMLNVRTIMQDVGDRDFGKLEDRILSMSTKFPQSANVIAKGFYDIASSGFASVHDGSIVLEAALVGATAGLTTTDVAARAITLSLNAYGMGAERAGHVSDLLFQSVNLGVFTFEQLSGALGDVVGLASQAGVSLKEVTGAMATMTLAGISVDESSTSLNRLIQQMIDPSESLAGAFHNMGFESGVAAIHSLGLHGVMERLNQIAGGNVTTWLKWLPEIRAVRGALALVANDGKSYDRVMKGMDDASKGAGAAQKAFSVQMESTGNSMAMFQNSVEAAGIALGSTFLMPVKMAFEAVTFLVNIFNQLPPTMQNIIAVGAAVSSMMLVLGGAFLAFRAKSILTSVILRTLGAGITQVGNSSMVSSQRVVGFGNAVSTASSKNFPMMHLGLAGINTGFQKFGGLLTSAGGHIQTFSGRVGVLGPAVSRVGQSFNTAGTHVQGFEGKLKSAARSVVGGIASMGALIGVVVALGAAWLQSQQAADQMIDTMSQDWDLKNVQGLNKALDDVWNAQGKLNKEMKGSADGVQNFAVTVGKNIVDMGLSVIGMGGIVKDSSIDQIAAYGKLDDKQKELIQTGRNLSENLRTVWNRTHPDDYREAIDLNSKQMRNFAKLVTAGGADLTKPFEDSKGARQQAVDDFKKLANNVGLSTDQLRKMGPAAVKAALDAAKAVEKAADSAGKAFVKGFDVSKAFDPAATDLDGNLISASDQITAFYNHQVETATQFKDDIQKAIRAGLDPQVVMQMFQAGPEAAGGALHALVADESGGLIELVNAATNASREMSEQIISYARITAMAIQDPTGKLVKDTTEAMDIQNQIFADKGRATVQTIANALHMDPADVKRIRDEFSLDVADSFNFDPGHAKRTLEDKIKETFRQIEFNKIFDNTALSGEQIMKGMRLSLDVDTDEGRRKYFEFLGSLTPEDRTVWMMVMLEARNKENVLNWIETQLPGTKELKVKVGTIMGGEINAGTLDDLIKTGMKPKDIKMLLHMDGTPEAQMLLANVDKRVKELEGDHKIKVVIDLDKAQKQVSDFESEIVKRLPPQKVMEIRTQINQGDFATARRTLQDAGFSDKQITQYFTLVGLQEAQKQIENYLLRAGWIYEAHNITTKFLTQGIPTTMSEVAALQQSYSLTPTQVATMVALQGGPDVVTGLAAVYQWGMKVDGVDPLLSINPDDLTPEMRANLDAWVAAAHSTPITAVDETADAAKSAEANVEKPKKKNAPHHIKAIDDTGAGVESAMRNIARVTGKTVTIHTKHVADNAGGSVLKKFFAEGGTEDHKPGIYHTQRTFAEPETGGEAYIPLGFNKRQNGMSVLKQVAGMFNLSLVKNFADGGITGEDDWQYRERRRNELAWQHGNEWRTGWKLPDMQGHVRPGHEDEMALFGHWVPYDIVIDKEGHGSEADAVKVFYDKYQQPQQTPTPPREAPDLPSGGFQMSADDFRKMKAPSLGGAADFTPETFAVGLIRANADQAFNSNILRTMQALDRGWGLTTEQAANYAKFSAGSLGWGQSPNWWNISPWAAGARSPEEWATLNWDWNTWLPFDDRQNMLAQAVYQHGQVGQDRAHQIANFIADTRRGGWIEEISQGEPGWSRNAAEWAVKMWRGNTNVDEDNRAQQIWEALLEKHPAGVKFSPSLAGQPTSALQAMKAIGYQPWLDKMGEFFKAATEGAKEIPTGGPPGWYLEYNDHMAKHSESGQELPFSPWAQQPSGQYAQFIYGNFNDGSMAIFDRKNRDWIQPGNPAYGVAQGAGTNDPAQKQAFIDSNQGIIDDRNAAEFSRIAAENAVDNPPEEEFDIGGWLKPGLTLARNNTGLPERILPPEQSGYRVPAMAAAGGVQHHTTLEWNQNAPVYGVADLQEAIAGAMDAADRQTAIDFKRMN